MAKIKEMTDNTDDVHQLAFSCPGCNKHHHFNRTWKFNEDFDKPTVSPSLLVRWTQWEGTKKEGNLKTVKKVCHSFIKNGMIQFLSDCTHDLKGQTVPLEDV